MRTKKKRRSRRGTLLILLGLLLVVAALLLTLYNIYDSFRAGKEADNILDKLQTVMEEEDTDDTSDVPSVYRIYDEMPTVMIDGYEYIGIIEIPTKNIKLPVMAKWDYTRLNIAPCLYYGSYITDDMVICAHNYTTHFGPIRDLEIGSDVYFINVDDQVYRYKVGSVEILKPMDVRDLIESDWDLSLFTCTSSGQTRCTVRCEKVD